MRVFRLQKRGSSSISRIHMLYALDFGGCETQMVNLATEYALRGLQGNILFCSLSKGGIAEKRILQLGFQVVCLNLNIWDQPLISLFKVIRFLRRFSLLMLITTGSEANVLGGVASKFADVLLVVTEEIGVRVYSRKQRFFISLAYKIANYNFAVSKLARDNLLRQGLVSPQKCIVSYAPLNLKKSEFKIQPLCQEIELLYLGRIDPEKDFILLFSSLSKVLLDGQDNFRLTIVGARTPEDYEYLKTSIKYYGLEGKTVIHQATRNPIIFIDNCHFLIQSSRSEGMGFSVLEAICRNKPVISTNVGIVPELILNGVHGFVSKTHEVNSFVEALSHALCITEIEYKLMTENVSKIDLSLAETSKYLKLLDSLGSKAVK